MFSGFHIPEEPACGGLPSLVVVAKAVHVLHRQQPVENDWWDENEINWWEAIEIETSKNFVLCSLGEYFGTTVVSSV